MNPDQIPFGLGGIPRPVDPRDFQLGKYQPPVAIPPSYRVDISAVPVKHQHKWGTCGAHAGSIFDAVLQAIKGVIGFDPSPKYLWKQIKTFDGFGLDEGTDMRSIMKALQDYGVCRETSMPNTPEETIEQYSNSAAIDDIDRQEAYEFSIGNYAFVNKPTLDQIKQAIYQNGVVIALVDIGDGWWLPSWAPQDILPIKLGNFVGHHFIVLYGYDTDRILFRNSWGTSWALAGDGFFDKSYAPHVLEIGTAITLPVDYVFTNDLGPGQTNVAVQKLQKRLGIAPATGFFGPKTARAVMQFQKANNITRTGFVGPKTRLALNTGMSTAQ
jgi:Putative peptidoglycan binding domain/Papain family cysteine protease